MQLSETIKLYMTRNQADLVLKTMDEYIKTVNGLVSDSLSGVSIDSYTTANVKAALPSALKNQCIRDAKSIVKKYNKDCRKAANKNKKFEEKGSKIRIKEPNVPVLKKPCCYINNQNFKFKNNFIQFPVLIDGKSKRLSIRTSLTKEQKALLENSKLGMMRIVCKNNKIIAQIAYEAEELNTQADGNIMGVDLGIKCPAVSYTSDGSVKFHGNGRQNKHMRRHYKALRKRLQKAKNIKAVKRISNKEQRIMKDIDHKISRDIVNTAIAHNVSTIRLEQLSNIRSSTRKSRKNNKSLHTWSFYRLAQYIEYKARLAGIKVEFVNPAYTSQMCPICGSLNHADDRDYECTCGYKAHRDLVGAINICNSTECVGDRNIRRTA